MRRQYPLANNYSPETFTLKFEHCSAIRIQTIRNLLDISLYAFAIHTVPIRFCNRLLTTKHLAMTYLTMNS